MTYSSQASQPMSEADLERILVDARTGNEARNVTGALVYADGVFLQFLEGEREVLQDLVDRIRQDSRHSAMKIFQQSAITERSFQVWRMAYLAPDLDQMSRWAGLDGAGTVDELLEVVHRDTSRVPKILVSVVEALASRAKRG
jgi:hypothetical protein